MKLAQAIAELRKRGTVQNRKVYARHGVKADMYGVSYAELGKLTKTIKQDHELARDLWATGNHDARVLATMIADPAAATVKQVDGWVKELDNYVLSDAVAGYVARTPLVVGRMRKWTAARGEWPGAVGWDLLASVARRPELVDDAALAARLPEIERRIHAAPNRTRYSMNIALIAIGLRSAELHRAAIAAAKRIGKVEVDHGKTGCKTPDAVPYMAKAWVHQTAKMKTAKKKVTKKKVAKKKAAG